MADGLFILHPASKRLSENSGIGVSRRATRGPEMAPAPTGYKIEKPETSNYTFNRLLKAELDFDSLTYA